MASSKPKIQGYIDQAVFNHFEAYRQENNLNQSQALEKILIKFLGGDRPPEIQMQDYSIKMDLQYAITEIEKLQERVKRLEITSNLEGDSLEITSNLESDSLEITSNLEGDSLEITSNLEGDSLEITSNLEGDSLEITSNLEGDSLEITSNLEGDSLEITGNLEGDSLEITGNLDSNLTITENSAVPLSEDLTQALSESPIELNKFVICAIDREHNLFYFWNGNQKGFSHSILNAKRYKSEGMAERSRIGILKDDYFADYYTGSFELRYNTVRYFKENSKYQPKGKGLVKT